MPGNSQQKKIWLIVGISLCVGSLHFITGEKYSGPFPLFVNGYMIDILLPLSLYFLLCLPNLDKSILKSWFAKALPVFSVGLTVEILQYLGIPIFGQTYDPIDFYMYAIGIILAALLDKQFFPHIFSFWNNHDEEIR